MLHARDDGALVLPEMVSVGQAGKAFAADGTLSDASAAERFGHLIQNLARAAEA